MKKIHWYVSMALCLTVAAGVINCKGRDRARYYNEEKKFSIRIPDKWERLQDTKGTDIIAVSPLEGFEDNFRENFNILVENLRIDMTLDDYYERGIPVFQQYTKEFTQYEKGYGKIDGEKCRWDVVSHQMGPLKIKVLIYTMIHERKGYLITFSAADEKFEQVRPLFKQTAESFRFE